MREDETQPINLHEGWETTGWEVKLPSSDGGLMDMLGGLTGGGSDATPKTYVATTTSTASAYQTVRLSIQKR